MRRADERGNHRTQTTASRSAQEAVARASDSAAAGFVQRQQHATSQQRKGHAQRYGGVDLDVQAVQQDLTADEDQHQSQRILQIDEAVHHRGQGEVQRPQAEDGEDV